MTPVNCRIFLVGVPCTFVNVAVGVALMVEAWLGFARMKAKARLMTPMRITPSTPVIINNVFFCIQLSIARFRNIFAILTRLTPETAQNKGRPLHFTYEQGLKIARIACMYRAGLISAEKEIKHVYSLALIQNCSL